MCVRDYWKNDGVKLNNFKLKFDTFTNIISTYFNNVLVEETIVALKCLYHCVGHKKSLKFNIFKSGRYRYVNGNSVLQLLFFNFPKMHSLYKQNAQNAKLCWERLCCKNKLLSAAHKLHYLHPSIVLCHASFLTQRRKLFCNILRAGRPIY